jgi:hypothetical protein
MLQATALEKGLGLEMSVGADIPLVLADPERIIQILTNPTRRGDALSPERCYFGLIWNSPCTPSMALGAIQTS